MSAVTDLISKLEALGASAEVIAIAVAAVEAVRPERQLDAYVLRRGLSASEWAALRQEVFARDGYVCQYCGALDSKEVDHIHPLVRGGTSDLLNLCVACKPCNSSKKDKTLEEWRRS